MAADNTGAPAPEEADVDLLSIGAAARAIFSRCETEFPIGEQGSHRIVRVTQARTEQLLYAIDFMERVISTIPEASILKLVQTFSAEQQKAFVEGKDPNLINSVDVARAAVGNSSLLLTLAAKIVKEIPQVVIVFTDLREEEIRQLPVEDLIVVVCKIFLVNYAFFTQTLRPILLSFGGALLSKVNLAKVV